MLLEFGMRLVICLSRCCPNKTLQVKAKAGSSFESETLIWTLVKGILFDE